ncbi:MAG TPA: MFS transporter [Gemmataceae bacterium]|nr:MFS transporter [Gemmataceae bacterium]
MHESPGATRPWLPALCAAAMFWSFSFGAGAPLASIWLKEARFSDTIVGLNTGIYYLGIAVAALAVPWMMRRWGRGTLIAGMVASGLTVAMFPWGGSLSGWFVLRILNGFAGAMSLIPLETMVNRVSEPGKRSRNFGYYAFCVAMGIALGTALGVQTYALSPRVAFLLGGCAAFVAGFIVLGWLPWRDMDEEHLDRSTPIGLGRNFLSYGSAWSQGFLEGGMIGLLPIYLLAIGLTKVGAGWLMAVIMIGVISFQVPVAWLADRLGRTFILVCCYIVTIGCLAALNVGLGLVLLTICLFFTGACSSAFYPLGLAILGERTPTRGLARTSAWFLGINCIGSLIGPVAAGGAMDLFGKNAVFAAGEAAVLLIILPWAAVRLYKHFAQTESPVIVSECRPVENRTAA